MVDSKKERPSLYWSSMRATTPSSCSVGWKGARARSLSACGACVEDLRLPWELRYETGRLTIIRVNRAVSALLAHLGTPAKPPKPCGRSPGRPKGRLSGKAKRYPDLKRSA